MTNYYQVVMVKVKGVIKLQKTSNNLLIRWNKNKIFFNSY